MFIFKFEKILSLKESMIKKCLLEIANIEAAIEKTERLKDILEEENKKRKDDLKNTLKTDPKKEMLLFISENIEKTQERIHKLDINIHNLKREKRDKLEEVKTLNIEKKKLEKLKKKEYESYVEEENKAETRFLDEISNIKTANRFING